MDRITTMQEYFSAIDQKLDKVFACSYPKLNAYYQELKTACFEVVQNHQQNFFDQLRALLSLDAQLQILLEYHKLSNAKFHEISEEEALIAQIKEDSTSYYRELIGLKASSEIPFGIMFLGDCNEIPLLKRN